MWSLLSRKAETKRSFLLAPQGQHPLQSMSQKSVLEEPAPWKLAAPLCDLLLGTREMEPEKGPAGVYGSEKGTGSPGPWEVDQSRKEENV